MRRVLRTIATVVLAAASSAAGAAERDPVAPAAGAEFYEKRVRPVLAENCYRCHGPQRQRSGLTLDSVPTILAGGDRGPAVVPGEPDESLLIRAIRYTGEDLRMPPRGKLADDQIADLVEWVRRGAPGPRHQERASRSGDEFDLAERRTHWAYQPVLPVSLPVVQNTRWCSSPIDFFILARLESMGLSPAPQADERALIRRVTFSLTGLPPAPDEIETFLSDHSPHAYERLVDRLLDSPHYGERWARHWLDLVRYGETLGFEFDYDLYNAWRYRDYVIRAFNADVPYDQFVVEHLAGDLLPEPRRHPTEGDTTAPLANLERHEDSDKLQRAKLHLLDRLDRSVLARLGPNDRIESAITNYELAFRMQAAVPELLEIGGESPATRRLYGLDDPVTEHFGTKCLLARRMVERGVRFVEVTPPFLPGANRWDQHDRLQQGHETMARATDRPVAALLTDLKARGLLERTLVVWGGEFGRTPVAQGTSGGRDHNPYGFTMWLAGGGVRGGMVYGATDEYGFHAVENKVEIHDLHATILHLLGIDHTRLTHRFGGRDMRLTDVYGNVLYDILAEA